MIETLRRFLLVLIMGLVLGCMVVDHDHALHVLKGQGYTDIDLGDASWTACSEDDGQSVTFTAKGPTGVPISGALCCGASLFGPAKNCTVRLD